MLKKTAVPSSERLEAEAREAERAAPRALLDARAAGEFVRVEAGRR